MTVCIAVEVGRRAERECAGDEHDLRKRAVGAESLEVDAEIRVRHITPVVPEHTQSHRRPPQSALAAVAQETLVSG